MNRFINFRKIFKLLTLNTQTNDDIFNSTNLTITTVAVLFIDNE